jgi:UDP-N-acetylmuramate dehydrogenase
MPSLKLRYPDLDRFRFIDDLECHFDEPMDRHTSMKMRSRAAVLAIPHSARALRETLRLARWIRIPLYVLGGGSNTLFASSTFDGIVLKLGQSFSNVDLIAPDLVRCGAGLDLKKAVSYSIECGLAGLEFGTGIPGTLGGAAAGNAGARHQDGRELGICDFIDRLICFDRAGQVWEVERGEFQYTYRASELREVVVVEMDLRLQPTPAEEINKNLRWFREKRKGQPYGLPSCGCIFKNPTDPETGAPVSAGKLIDQLGLKGYKLGDAEISDRHANFMINRNTASGEDFLALISLTQDLIRQRTGIDLDVEVQVVGGSLTHAIL